MGALQGVQLVFAGGYEAETLQVVGKVAAVADITVSVLDDDMSLPVNKKGEKIMIIAFPG